MTIESSRYMKAEVTGREQRLKTAVTELQGFFHCAFKDSLNISAKKKNS